MSLCEASSAFRLKAFRIALLIELVKKINGLKTVTKIFNKKDALVATLSGFIAAIVFGVISENIKIMIVSIIDPYKTLPPK